MSKHTPASLPTRQQCEAVAYKRAGFRCLSPALFYGTKDGITEDFREP